MTALAVILAAVPACLLLLLVLYVLVQILARMRTSPDVRIRWPGQVLYVLVILPALLVDVLLQYTLVALLFWDPARVREHTVTQRLERYLVDPAWRGAIARTLCGRVLDPLDPTGCHCHRRTTSA